MIVRLVSRHFDLIRGAAAVAKRGAELAAVSGEIRGSVIQDLPLNVAGPITLMLSDLEILQRTDHSRLEVAVGRADAEVSAPDLARGSLTVSMDSLTLVEIHASREDGVPFEVGLAGDDCTWEYAVPGGADAPTRFLMPQGGYTAYRHDSSTMVAFEIGPGEERRVIRL